MNPYTMQKLYELDQERLAARNGRLKLESGKPRRKPIFGPLAAGAGRRLRRFGEGLESWGTPPRPETEQRAEHRA